MVVPHVHRMHEEEVLSTMPAAPFLAPSTLVAVQNRFAPLIAEGGLPSRRLVLVGVQEDDVADSDTETLVSHEPEADVDRDPLT